MKNISLLLLLCVMPMIMFSQSINSKAVERTNNISASYVDVTGTKLKIIPPKGFSPSTKFTGFNHELAGSSIVITEIPGDVNKNMIGFDKKYLIKSGVVVDKQTFYKINGFDALLIEGQQVAYGKTYYRVMLLIGDIYRSYLVSASMISTSSQKHVAEVKESVLGVIYEPQKASDITDRFDFTVNVNGTGLQKANMMLSSLTYTDDGNMPSKTQEKTSMTIRKATLTKAITEDEKKLLCRKLFDVYPLDWNTDAKRDPKPFKAGNLSGYEIYSIGKNKELYKTELIYQVIVFNGLDYYVITGLTYGKFEENIAMFKKVAATLSPVK